MTPVIPEEPTAHAPWPDEEAENLAWLISGYTWAPRDLYERIRADLDTIREHWGDSIVYEYPGGHRVNVLSLCYHHSYWDPGDVWFEVEANTFDAIQNNSYHAWDSLNLHFAAAGGIDYGYAHVHSDNRVNPLRMIEAYERLPGIGFGWSPGGTIGEPPGLFAGQFGSSIGYVFSYGLGDCPSGCGAHAYYYFRSGPEKTEYMGWYGDYTDSTPPAWWSEASACIELAWRGDSEYQTRDTIPPARTTDLGLYGDQVGATAKVTFTAPGNDGMTGQAKMYEFSWATEPFTDITWPGARATIDARPPGGTITLTLSNLTPDSLIYIGLRTVDGRGNCSEISNLITSRNLLLDGWTQYTTTESELPTGTVTALYVDRQGATWAGTPNGVAQLIGDEWVTYTENNGLPSNYITSFGEDGYGRLWVGTLEGLAQYDDGHWIGHVPTGAPGNSKEIRCITGADDGSLWCGVGFNGAALFDGSDWTWLDSTNSGLRGTVVRDILVASNHDVWFATDQGVGQFDGTDWIFHDQPSGAEHSYATSIAESPVGTILVGTGNAYLSQYDGAHWSNVTLPSTNSYGNGSAIVEDIVATRGDHVWLGVYESLRWFADGNIDSVLVLTDSNSGLRNSEITSLSGGPDNSLWIGTRSSGVFRWDLSQSGIGYAAAVEDNPPTATR